MLQGARGIHIFEQVFPWLFTILSCIDITRIVTNYYHMCVCHTRLYIHICQYRYIYIYIHFLLWEYFFRFSVCFYDFLTISNIYIYLLLWVSRKLSVIYIWRPLEKFHERNPSGYFFQIFCMFLWFSDHF